MRRSRCGLCVFGSLVLAMWSGSALRAIAAPCLIVTLTGTHGGPQQPFNGLAGAGTLLRYGDESDGCGAVSILFDAGRGTTMRLSQLAVGTEQLQAVFFTHMHSDHTEGFPDLIQSRWSFHGTGPKIDVVCRSDVTAPGGFVISCRNFTAHISDAFIQSGEIAQRHSETPDRTAGGPSELIHTITFDPANEPRPVWSRGDVTVSGIRSAHTPDHVSYRVDTPAGSVVIGGDAGSDAPSPPRASSTSANVELLAEGADVLVHSAIHPIMGPGRGSTMYAYAFYRQSTATDLGALAERAGVKHLMLTHLIPSLGADQQYPFKVPGKPLTEEDYRRAVKESGYRGDIIIGTDLTSLRLPTK